MEDLEKLLQEQEKRDKKVGCVWLAFQFADFLLKSTSIYYINITHSVFIYTFLKGINSSNGCGGLEFSTVACAVLKSSAAIRVLCVRLWRTRVLSSRLWRTRVLHSHLMNLYLLEKYKWKWNVFLFHHTQDVLRPFKGCRSQYFRLKILLTLRITCNFSCELGLIQNVKFWSRPKVDHFVSPPDGAKLLRLGKLS